MIRIPLTRPDDPDLAAAWDEAKRTLMARGVTPAERRKLFEAIDADCCIGDRSRCRCEAKQVAMTDEDVDREKWVAVWRDEVEP